MSERVMFFRRQDLCIFPWGRNVANICTRKMGVLTHFPSVHGTCIIIVCVYPPPFSLVPIARIGTAQKHCDG